MMIKNTSTENASVEINGLGAKITLLLIWLLLIRLILWGFR